MVNKTLIWISSILFLIVLVAVWIFGFYSYPKVYPPPVFTSSHTVIYDTAKKYIYAIWPWYYEKTDTIIAGTVPPDVDSAAILEAHYATYQYTRTLQDSNLYVTWQDNISQNKAMPVEGFDYVWKKPQQVIQNVLNETNYSKYLYIAGSVNYPDAKYSDISLIFASRRTILGAGYIPFQKGLKVTFGTTIVKLK